MEELEKSNRYSTASHNEDMDFIFDNEAENFDLELRDENLDLSYVIKIYYRLFRKKFLATLREKIKKDFINILYLTLDCPNFTENSTKEDNPCNYIIEMQKQYPMTSSSSSTQTKIGRFLSFSISISSSVEYFVPILKISGLPL